MTAPPQTPGLTPEELNQFGAEIDALRDRVRTDLGESDALHCGVMRLQRWMEVAGRAVLVASGWFPPLVAAGHPVAGPGQDH